MSKQIITQSELALKILPQQYSVGTYLYYKGYQNELYVIEDELPKECFQIIKVDGSTLLKTDYSQKVSLATLKAYYQPVGMDITHIRDLAVRMLEGDEIENISTTTDDTTALMHLGNKQTLIHLREEIDKSKLVVETIQRHAQLIVDEMKEKLMEKVNGINNVVSEMNKQISRLDYIIQTIETYAGIKEDIVTIQQGIPGSEDTPVVIRQAVIYMDEEMALIDPEFDWQKISSFDKWLTQDDNYKTLMPDIKSIVAIKPRRYDKKYSEGNTAADRWNDWMMNQNNRVTLFLIRNGENLYRIESEHISLHDRLFPNADEYLEILKKEEKDAQRGWHYKNDDLSDSAVFRKRFTKVSFLLQGLFERSDVFAPHNFTGSLIKMTGLDGHIEMLYELDRSKLLGDGKPAFSEWVEQLNANLTEGKRILLINNGYNHSGYEFERRDYVTYYSSDWNTPGYPKDGIYTLYKSNPKGYDKYYEERHPYIIKFMSDQDTYSWGGGFEKRKNRTSIHINPKYDGILNYDDLKMEDIDYYLHSRLHRSQYHQFVVMLQKAKYVMLAEQCDEDDFIRMMVGQMMHRNLSVKDGYTPETVVRIALDKVKNRLKWKRPVSTKEKETYTLVERNLFSKQNIEKYFK